MKVALYQNIPVFGRVRENVDTVVNAVADKDFDVLVLPELFATGYLFENTAEALGMADAAGEGYTFECMRNLAADKNALVVYGFPEKREQLVYNSALAVLPDGNFFLYQKTHLFNTEKDIFSPGETGFSVIDFRGAKIGIMICFDWRFPESARKLALLGADLICHPSNLVLPHCPSAMVIRALENRVFTVTADRAGTESRAGQNLKFIGRSRIISPDGDVLGELGEHEAGFLMIELDPDLARDKSATARNDIFRDRRPEFY